MSPLRIRFRQAAWQTLEPLRGVGEVEEDEIDGFTVVVTAILIATAVIWMPLAFAIAFARSRNP